MAKTASGRPSKAELLASAGKRVPDVIGFGLQVLFCGINPGLYSGWAGHHFARPGNRFWRALFASGFTKRLYRPDEEDALLPCGYGITNLVDRATLGSAELTRAELVEGAWILGSKIKRYRPHAVAILGVSAYRLAFSWPEAKVGVQKEKIENTLVWVLPNPSGLNAHFTPKALARVFREFKAYLGRP